MKCDANACSEEGIGYVALEIFPTKGYMDYYRAHHPLTTFYTTLCTCRTHFVRDGAELRGMFPEAVLTPQFKQLEERTGITVDRAGTKLVLIPPNQPEVQSLLAAKAAHKVKPVALNLPGLGSLQKFF